MSVQVKRRRGSSADHAAFTGAQGELTVNTDTNRVHVQDGTTAGGHPLALLSDTIVVCIDSGSANTIVANSNVGPTGLVDGMILSAKVAATNTSGVTINYNGAGAKALVSGTGAALVAGALQTGGQILAQYRATGTEWLLLARDGGAPQFSAPLPVNQGGTGATTAPAALTALGAVPVVSVGAANGVASLDSGGRVPISQLPTALAEAIFFAGTWNASTNAPALASGTGTNGAAYKVSVAGTTTLDGISTWSVGDLAVFNGTAATWEKIDGQSTEVLSVVGQTGAVTAAQISTALGLGGAALLNVGTTAGTVADGGALATETTNRVNGDVANATAAANAQTTANAAIPSSALGQPGGPASLDPTLGTVPIAQMPSGPTLPQPRMYTGSLRMFGGASNGTSTYTPAANNVFWYPIMVPEAVIISQLGARITTLATGTMNIGIYSNDPGGSYDQPSSLLGSVSASTGSTGTIMTSLSTPITLEPNVLYWMAFMQTGSAVIMSPPSPDCALGWTAGQASSNSTLQKSGTSLPATVATSSTFNVVVGNTRIFIMAI